MWTNGVPNNDPNTTYMAVIQDTTSQAYSVQLYSDVTVNSLFLDAAASLYVNTGGRLTLADPAPSQVIRGSLCLAGGTLCGGQINLIPPGALGFKDYRSGVLDATALQGNIGIPNRSAGLVLTNGANLADGTVTISGRDAWLEALGGASLGNDTIALAGTYSMNPARLYLGSLAVIGTAVTVRGGSGLIICDASTPITGPPVGTIENLGTISADVSGRGLSVTYETFLNNGIAEAKNAGSLSMNATFVNNGILKAEDGGTLSMNGTLVNNGILRAEDGGTLSLDVTNWSNPGGTIFINNGTMNLGGSFSVADMALPRWQRTGGTVNLTGILDNSDIPVDFDLVGPLRLVGGTIKGGTIPSTSPLVFTSTRGALDGGIWQGDMLLTGDNKLRLVNGASFTGLNLSLASANADLLIDQDMDLSDKAVRIDGKLGITAQHQVVFGATTVLQVGSGWIRDNGSVVSRCNMVVDGKTFTISTGSFTNESSMTVRNGGTLTISAQNWVNENGSIITASPGSSLNFTGNWSNHGTIVMDSATVQLGAYGSWSSTANWGIDGWVRKEGIIYVSGTSDNSGTVVDLAKTGSLILKNATIRGGDILATPSSHLVATNYPSILDGVTLHDDVSVFDGRLTLLNGADFTGSSITVQRMYGEEVALTIGEDYVLKDKTVTLESGGPDADHHRAYLIPGEDNTLILDANSSITGSLGAISGPYDAAHGRTASYGHLINRGTISPLANGASFLIKTKTFSNQGTVRLANGILLLGSDNWTNEANGLISVDTGSWLNLGGTWTNLGRINTAPDSSVRIDGNVTTAGMGVWNRLGGSLFLGGVVDNTADTLDLDIVGPLTALGGTIKGGDFYPRSTFSGMCTLDGATWHGDLQLSPSTITSITFTNGASFTGSNLSTVYTVGGSGSPVIFDQDILLDGKTIFLGGGSLSCSSGHKLILGPNTSVRGQCGGVTGDILENRGIILADNANINFGLTVQSRSSQEFINYGTIKAINGAPLWVWRGYTQLDGMTWVGAGSMMMLVRGYSCCIDIEGGVVAGSGMIQAGGTPSRVIVNNGVLSPGDAVGTLTFSAGTGAGPWTMELGPQATMLYDLSTPGTVGQGVNDLVTLDGNLILDGILSIDPLPGFGNGTYRLFAYTGTLTDNGLEVGSLPEGWLGTVDTTTPGQVNLLVIPEPATLSLLALGGLALLRRRR